MRHGAHERVYVENERHDGPRAGIADIDGVPHRFQSLFDHEEDEYASTFMVWPIDHATLALELEQWSIFVDWNTRFEAGEVDTDSHPGHGGLHARWDELDAMLTLGRSTIPVDAKRARARVAFIDRDLRYAHSGPDYTMCWHVM